MRKWALSLALGVVIGVVLVVGGASAHSSSWLLGFAVAGLFVAVLGLSCLLLAIVVHELGHVLTGLGTGLELRFVQILNVGLSNATGRLRPYFVRGLTVAGMVSMMPREGEASLRQYRWFVAGGPIASVLFVLVNFLLWLTTRTESRDLVPILIHLGTWVGLVVSLITLTGTLVPYYSRGHATDALILWQLARPGAVRDRTLAMFEISSAAQRGERPRDWSEEAVERVTLPTDGSPGEFLALYYALLAYGDGGENEKADRVLERSLSLLKPSIKGFGLFEQAFLYEAAWYVATAHRKVEDAEEILARTGKPYDLLEGNRLLAMAAIASARGNHEAAREAAKAAYPALVKTHEILGGSLEASQERVESFRPVAGMETRP